MTGEGPALEAFAKQLVVGADPRHGLLDELQHVGQEDVGVHGGEDAVLGLPAVGGGAASGVEVRARVQLREGLRAYPGVVVQLVAGEGRDPDVDLLRAALALEVAVVADVHRPVEGIAVGEEPCAAPRRPAPPHRGRELLFWGLVLLAGVVSTVLVGVQVLGVYATFGAAIPPDDPRALCRPGVDLGDARPRALRTT